MYPNAPAPNRRARRPLRMRIFKICVAGCLVFFLALLLGLGIPILREFSRPIAPPKFENTANNLLIRTDSPSGRTDRAAALETTRNTTPANQVTTPTTSSTVSFSTVHFKSFIPDTINLPKEKKEITMQLNARFDGILQRIAKYEASKEKLDPRVAQRTVISIDGDYEKIRSEVEKMLGRKRKYGVREPYDDLDRRDDEFYQWFLMAWIENAAKERDYKTAAERASGLITHNIGMWINNHPNLDSMSEFLRGPGELDYEREIYYWRQVGGFQGIKNVSGAFTWRQIFRLGVTLKRVSGVKSFK
jgi:hypothetical protein